MKPSFLFIIPLIFISYACTPPAAQEATPTVTATLPTTTPTMAPTGLPTMTPTSVLKIFPTPSSIVPFDERLLARLNIEREPDEIVFVQGFIWTKTANGHVFQVDPVTNTIVGDIKVDTTSDPYHYCQGLSTDGENIWVCSASGDADHRSIDVVRIDPQSQSIVETIKVEKVFDQSEMPFLLNKIWVLSGSGDQLVGIDVATNQPSSPIDLGVRCFQLAAVAEALIATCAVDNLVLRIDPGRGEVTEQVTLKNPRNLAGTENAVWVLQDNAVVRLDPRTLQPVIEFTHLSNVGLFGDLFVSEETVWIRQDSGFLYRIDPAGNQIVEQIKADQSLSGGSLLITSDSIWTTAYDDNLLIRLGLE